MIQRAVGIALLPSAVASAALAFRFPDAVETLYAQGLYPEIAAAYGVVNRFAFSLAEAGIVAALVAAAFGVVRLRRARADRGRIVGRVLWWSWLAAGALVTAFLWTWGFNYARPPLRSRAALDAEGIGAAEVLAAAERTAALTAALYADLGADGATALPMSFVELDRALDEALERAALPDLDAVSRGAPAKPLTRPGSTLLSYLGISGIYVPFTGEPSVNALQPDASLPVVVGHEKAHQRGITDEGEANFAAFVACADARSPRYLRYAAYLFATRYLLGEASRYVAPEALAPVWDALGDGALADVRAIQDFWSRYQGPAQEVAREVNDRYLRTMRVPDGVQSYGTVVELLIALDREGRLVPGAP